MVRPCYINGVFPGRVEANQLMQSPLPCSDVTTAAEPLANIFSIEPMVHPFQRGRRISGWLLVIIC